MEAEPNYDHHRNKELHDICQNLPFGGSAEMGLYNVLGHDDNEALDILKSVVAVELAREAARRQFPQIDKHYLPRMLKMIKEIKP